MCSHEAEKNSEWLQARVKFICNNLTDKLNPLIEKLGLTDHEFVCLKALLALDPNVSGISSQTYQTLSVARDSVQNALYLYLADHYSSEEAVGRFGNLLMLLANITVRI